MLPTRLTCSFCNWSELCDVAVAIKHLSAAGMLRRNSNPSAHEVEELLLAALPRLKCPTCEQTQLQETPADDWGDGNWPEARLCDECDAPIHPERLEILPETRLCTACQRRDETGDPNLAEDVYCPRCGSPMLVKPSSGHGVTRYVWVCSQYPACRGR